jgi:hypothetical protein
MILALIKTLRKAQERNISSIRAQIRSCLSSFQVTTLRYTSILWQLILGTRAVLAAAAILVNI